MIPTNEVLKQALINLVNSVNEQLPQVLNQVLHWAYVKDIMSIALSGIFLILSILGIIYTSKKFKKLSNDYWDQYNEICNIVILAASICLLVFSSVFLIFYIWDLTHLVIAPKSYLLEYAQNFISK